jgi:hypothetical protein
MQPAEREAMIGRADFVALFGAFALLAAPAQGEMVFTPQHAPIDSAKLMLPICENEIAQGSARLCTGYIIAVALEMAVHREGCLQRSPIWEGENDYCRRHAYSNGSRPPCSDLH